MKDESKSSTSLKRIDNPKVFDEDQLDENSIERVYLLAMEVEEVLDELTRDKRIIHLRSGKLNQLQLRSKARKFALELENNEFRLHCVDVSPGSTSVGILPTLFLRGIVETNEQGAKLTIRFRYGRPAWALQRAAGFFLTAILGMFWVVAGTGNLGGRAIMLTLFALFTLPVVVHDLQKVRKLRRHQGDMLSLIEELFASRAIGEDGARKSPYRQHRNIKRLIQPKDKAKKESDGTDDCER